MENYFTPPGATFLNALTADAMLQPDSLGTAPLFDPTYFSVVLSNDASINNGSGVTFTLPLRKIYIVINVPYGVRDTYMDNDYVEDWLMSVKLEIYGATGASVQDAKTRLEFATVYRQDVFSANGILDVGIDEHPRFRQYDSRQGICAMDYTLRFRYSPNT